MEKAKREKTKIEEMKSLIARTNRENPKPENLKLMRQELDAKPEFYRSVGNLKKQVFSTILKGDFCMLTIPEGVGILEFVPEESEELDTARVTYPQARERFHLDDVGMSSFTDKWNVILVERSDRVQRLIWRNLKDMKIHETLLPPGHFETVAAHFVTWASTSL